MKDIFVPVKYLVTLKLVINLLYLWKYYCDALLVLAYFSLFSYLYRENLTLYMKWDHQQSIHRREYEEVKSVESCMQRNFIAHSWVKWKVLLSFISISANSLYESWQHLIVLEHYNWCLIKFMQFCLESDAVWNFHTMSTWASTFLSINFNLIFNDE